ncbi:hypothetical protein DFH09DRAFT_1145778 [Mycena vulgaris]|nr:hypothetical protein DFH09DRAFT_1145778 [Mycena vulgaris]
MDSLGPAIILSIFQSILDDAMDFRSPCALASRPLLIPAQRLLFRHIYTRVEQTYGGSLDPVRECLRRLSDVFTSSPHLLAFVRKVQLGSMYSQGGWDAMQILLQTLQPAKIERFSISGAVDDMPANVRAALAGVLSQPSLQDVTFTIWGNVRPEMVAAAFASCRKVCIACSGIGTLTLEAERMAQPPVAQRWRQTSQFFVYGHTIIPIFQPRDPSPNMPSTSLSPSSSFSVPYAGIGATPMIMTIPGMRVFEPTDQTPDHAESPRTEDGRNEDPPDAPGIVESSDSTPVEELVITCKADSGEFLLDPLISPFITRLRELDVCADGLAALHLCSDTLTHLTIRETRYLECVEFPQLGALRVLTLDTLGCYIPWEELDVCAASLPNSLPVLEVLNLKVRATGSEFPPLRRPRKAVFPEVDSALTALPCVREIHCIIRDGKYKYGNEITLQDFQEGVEKLLPGAHRAGLLKFSRRDEDRKY